MTAILGKGALLNCRVRGIGNRTVGIFLVMVIVVVMVVVVMVVMMVMVLVVMVVMVMMTRMPSVLIMRRINWGIISLAVILCSY